MTMNHDHDDDTTNKPLEPRVAKLEVGLDRLTDDVRSLAAIVRDKGSNVEKQLNQLTVAVTQAAGPRKTDWTVIISAVFLVLAIGSAVFWPLNQQVSDNKSQLDKVENRLSEADKQFEIKNDLEHQALKTCFRQELEQQKKLFDAEIALAQAKADGVQKYNELYIDKLFGRVQSLEAERIKVSDKEHDELMLWRQKAMGLKEVTPNPVPVLVTPSK